MKDIAGHKQDRLANLEDLYQLSPMQQGMLFHTLYAPDTGAYVEQTLFTIRGALDVSAFERAWQTIVLRHPILRSAFLWEELEFPQQVVRRSVNLAIEKMDWRGRSPAEQDRLLAEHLASDRWHGFDLGTAPLLRLALFKLSDEIHKLVFSRHHLLLDRWSRSLLLRELFVLYEAFSRGVDQALPAPRPYVDYIRWLQTQERGPAERYWRRQLRGFSAPTALQIEPGQEGAEAALDPYAEERFQLSEASTQRLQAFAREHQLTQSVIVQAAWAVLLSRYSGDRDVVFGVTVAGRPAALAGVEAMVGLFINTLPHRVSVLPETPVSAWLKDVQTQQADLQQFEHSSLLDIQGWSEVPRGTPLFESILVFENLLLPGVYEAAGRSITMREDRGYGSTTGYPLTLLVSPGTQLTAQLVYDRRRFERTAIHRMLGHFRRLLENLPNQGGSLRRVAMLSDAECQHVVREWNDTGVVRDGMTFLGYFERQVVRTPNAAALRFGNEELTYRDLNARANRLARYLQRLGVGPDGRVGICIEPGPMMAVAVLGALKAGGAYVPLDPGYPSERLTFMLDDAHCRVVLTDQRLAERLPCGAVPVVCLDRVAAEIAEESSENPDAGTVGEQLAYVIYTSGSTGRPKGVGMTWGALSNLIAWQLQRSVAPERTLQFASLSFDVSFQELFSTWCAGGTLLLVTETLKRDPRALLALLTEEQVTRLFLPFIYLQHLAEAADNGSLPEQLRDIITAGEQLEVTPQIARFCRRLKDCTLENQYGPTESHVVTAHRLAGSPEDWPTRPPIGRPIANTQVYVLDRELQPLPIGVAGELYIGGTALSRGYLGRPELTAEMFIPDPFNTTVGARLYRTGDWARYGRSGFLEFLGRQDRQVKLRGCRMELGEIEAVLMTHPGIREAAVVLSGAGRARRLIGYVVQTANAAIGLESEVRGFLRTQLPEPMLPTDFVWLDALPLTPSGKVDRRALPSPEVCSRNSDAAFRAPRTEVEQRLAAIWSKVLGRERIAVTDDFFELGGHSLLATQLVSRIRSAFGKEVSLRQVFESPTLEDLALVLGELRSRTPGDGLLEYREGGASSGSNRAEPSGTRDSR